jgi:hypothetical protein
MENFQAQGTHSAKVLRKEQFQFGVFTKEDPKKYDMHEK